MDQFPLSDSMLKVGLTGGIGCGKTTVANLFAEKGVPVIDADQISHQLVEPGWPAFQAIVRQFGEDVLLDGRLNRRLLKEQVFSRTDEREWLENLLHPLIYHEMQRQVEALSATYCLLVVPLLLETGRRDFVDRLLVVDCPPETQRQRIRIRDGLDDKAIDLILATQLNREQRLVVADDVVENFDELAVLRPQIDRLHHFYTAPGLAP
jgi:dephospho-CoA kinase